MTTTPTSDVQALVITGYGLNCEMETKRAFQQAGATVELVHLNDILNGYNRLQDYHILVFMGGFSFGDHLGAGTVFANRIKCRMRDQLENFIKDGKLILGICNGFQTITRLGLVPYGQNNLFNQSTAIAENEQGVFRDAWVKLKINADCPCIFTKGLDYLYLPVRHGEGRFVTDSAETAEYLKENNLIAMQYADPVTGNPSMDFPHNPNGSWKAVAGICDPSGRIFGLMPHPEAFISPYNHPDWPRQKAEGLLPEKGTGQIIFDNAVNFAAAEVV